MSLFMLAEAQVHTQIISRKKTGISVLPLSCVDMTGTRLAPGSLITGLQGILVSFESLHGPTLSVLALVVSLHKPMLTLETGFFMPG